MGCKIWAVVALKSPDTAKSRLRALLTDAERRDLYFHMAGKVITSLKQTAGIDKVLVVTSGNEVERIATQLGVDVIRQDEERGTAAAFAHAVKMLTAVDADEHPTSLLMVAGDLPLISPAALSSLIHRPGALSGVSIVPDRKRIGTNALLCSPPDASPPCFGAESFDRHRAAARVRGIAVHVHESDALSLDIDGAEDLAMLSAQLAGSPDLADAALCGLLARLHGAAPPSKRESLANVHFS